MKPLNAAIAAGYSPNYAKAKAYRIERLVEVGIADELERAGITASYRAKELYKLTQAVKSQVCDLYIQKNENGKWVMNENMNSFIEVEDNSVRLNAHKHISELLGDVKSKIEHSGSIKTGETKIVIINSKEESAKIGNRTNSLPTKISI